MAFARLRLKFGSKVLEVESPESRRGSSLAPWRRHVLACAVMARPSVDNRTFLPHHVLAFRQAGDYATADSHQPEDGTFAHVTPEQFPSCGDNLSPPGE